jgi:alpha-1,6-mannosyltransferase
VSDTSSLTSRVPWFIPALAAIVLASVTSGWMHGLSDRADAGYLPLFLVPWALAALFALGVRVPPLWGIAVAAVAARFVFIGAPPWLSDDLFRYLAEGHALNAGENPFVISPSAMTSISESLRERVNHAEMTTLYPPIALAWFRLMDALGGTVVAAQALSALCDLFTVAAILKVAGRRWALLYAVYPLGPLEAAMGAHVDTLAVALVAWAVVCARKWPLWTGVLLALGAGVKLLPAALIPVAAKRYGWRPVLMGTAIGSLLVLVALVPVVDAGLGLFTTLQTYGQSWSFNGLGLWVLSPLPSGMARPILGCVGLVAVGWATWKSETVHGAWLVIGAAFLFVTPTAHPWYLMWVVVPSLLARRWGWLAASIPLMCSYAVLLSLRNGGSWTEQPWLLPLTWGPAVIALGIATWQWRRPNRQPTP